MLPDMLQRGAVLITSDFLAIPKAPIVYMPYEASDHRQSQIVSKIGSMYKDSDPHNYKDAQNLLHCWKGVDVDMDKVHMDWAYHNVLIHSPLEKAAVLAENMACSTSLIDETFWTYERDFMREALLLQAKTNRAASRPQKPQWLQRPASTSARRSAAQLAMEDLVKLRLSHADANREVYNLHGNGSEKRTADTEIHRNKKPRQVDTGTDGPEGQHSSSSSSNVPAQPDGARSSSSNSNVPAEPPTDDIKPELAFDLGNGHGVYRIPLASSEDPRATVIVEDVEKLFGPADANLSKVRWMLVQYREADTPWALAEFLQSELPNVLFSIKSVGGKHLVLIFKNSQANIRKKEVVFSLIHVRSPPILAWSGHSLPLPPFATFVLCYAV